MKRWNMLGWLGQADIRVIGRFPEKFINLASAHGVRMWDTVISDDELRFKTGINSLKSLKEVQEKTGYIMEIHRKSGFFVLAQTLFRRKLLLAGFFCFWLALYYLAGMIWQIDIHGLEALDPIEVKEYTESLGLEKWARIGNLDLNDIEGQLYLRFPEIAWVAIEKSGTKVSIRIVEKEPDPLQFGEPIDIVAEYDGIISEMMVMQGIALVNPGMTVAKGDVLISGYREAERIINAAGYVKAVVHVEGYGEAAMVEIEKKYTGNEVLTKTLQIGSTNISLSRKEHGFDNYEIIEAVRPLRGNLNLPVRMIHRRYREIELITKEYSQEEAQELAKNRAMMIAHQQVGEHADILKTDIKDITIDSIFRYKVTITIETKIGQEKAQVRGDEIIE